MAEFCGSIYTITVFLLISIVLRVKCESYTSPDTTDKLGHAYEFKIHVDAGREECFYQHVQANSTLYVAFQVMRGGDGKAGFLIRSPAGQVILPYQWQASAEHEDNLVAIEGYYQFCIDNSLSRFASKLVSLYVAAYRRSEWESYIEELTAADITVSNFTNSLSNVDRNIGIMLKSLDQSRRLHSHDWYLVVGNNRYIQNWSLAQCLVIILTSVIQVYVLRNFFTADSPSIKGKPRA